MVQAGDPDTVQGKGLAADLDTARAPDPEAVQVAADMAVVDTAVVGTDTAVADTEDMVDMVDMVDMADMADMDFRPLLLHRDSRGTVG